MVEQVAERDSGGKAVVVGQEGKYTDGRECKAEECPKQIDQFFIALIKAS